VLSLSLYIFPVRGCAFCIKFIPISLRSRKLSRFPSFSPLFPAANPGMLLRRVIHEHRPGQEPHRRGPTDDVEGGLPAHCCGDRAAQRDRQNEGKRRSHVRPGQETRSLGHRHPAGRHGVQGGKSHSLKAALRGRKNSNRKSQGLEFLHFDLCS
jgi:hypothetical protein